MPDLVFCRDPPEIWMPVTVRAPDSRIEKACTALVDTGAVVTCIPEAWTSDAGMNLQKLGKVLKLTMLDDSPKQVPLYRAEVLVDGRRAVNFVGVLGAGDMVVGLDILGQGTLVMEGLEHGTFELKGLIVPDLMLFSYNEGDPKLQD